MPFSVLLLFVEGAKEDMVQYPPLTQCRKHMNHQPHLCGVSVYLRILLFYRQLLIVIVDSYSRTSGGYYHVMWCNRAVTEEELKKTRGSTSGSHCASLSLLAPQAFSLVSFPFTNLFLTLSLSRFTLKFRTAGKRQTGIT